MLGMRRQQVKQVATTSQLGYYKEFIVDTKDVVQSNDIVVPAKFAQDIDFLLQLGNVLGVVAEHDTLAGKLFPLAGPVGGLVSLRFAAGRNADLSVAALANDQVAVQQIGGSTLGRIEGFSSQVVGCRGRIIGDGRRRKGGLQTVGAGSSRVLVKGHHVVGRHGRLLLWRRWLLRVGCGTRSRTCATGHLLLVLHGSSGRRGVVSTGAAVGLSGARAPGVSTGRPGGAASAVVVIGVFS